MSGHPHGSRKRYLHGGCRCTPCRRANTAYQANRRRLHAYGRPGFVPAAPVRDHVRQLMAAGLPKHRIAAAAGVAEGTLSRLLYAPHAHTRQVRRETAQRLLAVRDITAAAAPVLPDSLVDATGTTRRLQALAALGWSNRRLAALLGRHERNLNVLLHGRRSQVVHRTAREVADLYDRLWHVIPDEDRPGQIRRARLVATRNRWVPPLAWDDDQIDDPDATPVDCVPKRGGVDPVAVDALVAGRMRAAAATVEDRRAAIAELTRRGVSTSRIALQLGMASRSVIRLRSAA